MPCSAGAPKSRSPLSRSGRWSTAVFLNGPLCPIYGFGMVGLLAVLGGWRRNLLAVFFIGMALATLLELVGGYLLYRLFHTRWWDYSQNRGNLGGFICPKFSLLWGRGERGRCDGGCTRCWLRRLSACPAPP